MSTGHTVVVVGSANVDLIATVPEIPAPGQTVLATGREERAGGKGLNQAVAAARAGAATVLVAAVGRDAGADLLLDAATGAGVDVSLVRRVGGPSGSAWIMVDGDGENSIVVDGAANSRLTRLNDEERAAVTSAAVLVTQLETPLSVVAEAVSMAHDAGVRVVLNAAPSQSLPGDLLAGVDVLVVNEGEVRALSGEAEPEAAARALVTPGHRVVVTLGARGALIADESGLTTVPGVPAEVVDTTGAGDTFTGFVAAALAAGDDLEQAATRAVVAGALAVETAGAVPSIPTAQAVSDRLAAAEPG